MSISQILLAFIKSTVLQVPPSTGTTINTGATNALAPGVSGNIHATRITDNRVLAVFLDGAESKAAVFDTTGGIVTVGPILTVTGSNRMEGVAVLTPSLAFVVYANGSGAPLTRSLVISDMIISLGSAAVSPRGAGETFGILGATGTATKVNSTQVIFNFQESASIQGIFLAEVSSTSVTIQQRIHAPISASQYPVPPKIAYMSDNLCTIASMQSTSLKAAAITVSGPTMTIGEFATLVTGFTAGANSLSRIAQIDSERAMFAFQATTSPVTGASVLIIKNVAGAISAGNVASMGVNNTGPVGVSALSPARGILLFTNPSNQTHRAAVFTFTDTSVVAGPNTIIVPASGIPLSNGDISASSSTYAIHFSGRASVAATSTYRLLNIP